MEQAELNCFSLNGLEGISTPGFQSEIDHPNPKSYGNSGSIDGDCRRLTDRKKQRGNPL
jgi:hypothetical protein